MNFVPCVTWVERGIPKSQPSKVQVTQEELKKIAAASSEKHRIATGNPDVKENGALSEYSELDDEYGMDTYDDENDGTKVSNQLFFKAEDLDFALEDSYVTADDDESEEIEDFMIKESDNLLVVGHVDDDSSTLEIYVYNEEAGDLYVHHDIILPAYPVALEWLNFHPSSSSPGNYIAVGDMTSQISIWNLDVVDMLEPEYVLGEKTESSKSHSHLKIGHIDAVLDVKWNRHLRNILASGSADEKICLWNLEMLQPATMIEYKKGKVQSLQWHPHESQFLLSGSTDGHLIVHDCRSTLRSSASFSVSGEVEKVVWNYYDSFCFLCSTDQGNVHCFDTRNNKETYNFKAHDAAVTGLTLSYECPGCLVTASTDRTVKVWDILNKPEFVATQKMKIGSVFDAKVCPDSPFIVAFGGDKSSNNVTVKSMLELENCSHVFGNRSLRKVLL